MARKQMLLTAALKKQLASYPLYSQEKLGASAKVVVKFFAGSRMTYYVTEGESLGDGDYRLFGYMVSPLGPDCDEYGYSLLSELQKAGVERDAWLKPGKTTLADHLPGLRPATLSQPDRDRGAHRQAMEKLMVKTTLDWWAKHTARPTVRRKKKPAASARASRRGPVSERLIFEEA
jgi:hypothetical protein